jgi:LPS export ABC transporter protein LptC
MDASYFSAFYRLKFCVILLAITFIWTSCENDIEKVKIVTNKKAMPIEKGKDVEILYSDSARIKARLLAKELNRFAEKQPYVEMPKGIKMYFYDSNQKVNSTLTSEYAKVLQFPDNNIMEAKRKVVVVNEKNETLNTEHLVWNQKEETIVSDAYVTITTKDEIIMGDGLESNQSFTKYKIKKMKGIINLKK